MPDALENLNVLDVEIRAKYGAFTEYSYMISCFSPRKDVFIVSHRLSINMAPIYMTHQKESQNERI